jgi:hypothetical protein
MSRYDIALGKPPPLVDEPLPPPPPPADHLLILGCRRSGKTETLIQEIIRRAHGTITLGGPNEAIVRNLSHSLRERTMNMITNFKIRESRLDSVNFVHDSGHYMLFCDEIQAGPSGMRTSSVENIMDILSRTPHAVATCDLGHFLRIARQWPRMGEDVNEVFQKAWQGQYEGILKTQFMYDRPGSTKPVRWDALFLPLRHLVSI